jgi:hypothetical protein
LSLKAREVSALEGSSSTGIVRSRPASEPMSRALAANRAVRLLPSSKGWALARATKRSIAFSVMLEPAVARVMRACRPGASMAGGSCRR